MCGKSLPDGCVWADGLLFRNSQTQTAKQVRSTHYASTPRPLKVYNLKGEPSRPGTYKVVSFKQQAILILPSSHVILH